MLWRNIRKEEALFHSFLTSALDGMLNIKLQSLNPRKRTPVPISYWYVQILVGRDSWVDIATRYGAGRSGDRIPESARFSAPVQTGPGAHPASYTIGAGSFPGVKRPRRGVDHPPTSSVEVKEGVELYLYSPSGPSWPVLGWTLLLPLCKISYYQNYLTVPLSSQWPTRKYSLLSTQMCR